MKLSDIADNAGSRKKRMRARPRHRLRQGQTAAAAARADRALGRAHQGFEGGQMPLHRRLPKPASTTSSGRFAEHQFDRLQEAIDAKLVDAKEAVTVETLVQAGDPSRQVT